MILGRIVIERLVGQRHIVDAVAGRQHLPDSEALTGEQGNQRRDQLSPGVDPIDAVAVVAVIVIGRVVVIGPVAQRHIAAVIGPRPGIADAIAAEQRDQGPDEIIVAVDPVQVAEIVVVAVIIVPRVIIAGAVDRRNETRVALRVDPVADGDDPPIVPELHLAHRTVVEQPRELAVVASRHPGGQFPPKLTQRAVAVEVDPIVTSPLAVEPLGGALFGSLDSLTFDPRSLGPFGALDPLALDPLQALGRLNAFTFNPLRPLGALDALALYPLRSLGALDALALDPLRPL